MNGKDTPAHAIWLWNNGQMPPSAGDGFQPWLDPFPVEGEEPHGAVIVCPGGGYSHRAPHEGAPVAQWLNTLGLAAFVLHYRVSPHRHPTPLQDAQRAIRLVRARAAQWNINPHRVGILGFSAGGHLATSAATLFESGNPVAADLVERESSRPDLLIAGYPVVSFGRHGHSGSADNLLGPEASAELRASLSLENRVSPAMPPAFIWHTEDDGAVPVENSRMLANAMAQHRVPHVLHVFPHGRHGLGLGEPGTDVATWPDRCAAWLKGMGWVG